MNYKKVIEGFNNGTLNKDIITLVMDNDGGYWSVNTGSEEVDEIIEGRLEEAYGTPDGYKDIATEMYVASVVGDAQAIIESELLAVPEEINTAEDFLSWMKAC